MLARQPPMAMQQGRLGAAQSRAAGPLLGCQSTRRRPQRSSVTCQGSEGRDWDGEWSEFKKRAGAGIPKVDSRVATEPPK